jgi:hypothetical protein
MVALVFLTATAIGLLAYGHFETQSSLLAGLVAVLFAAGLAVIISRSLTKPLVQMTAAVGRRVCSRPRADSANKR